MGDLGKKLHFGFVEFLFFGYFEKFLLFFHLPFLTPFVPTEPSVYQA